MHQVKKPRTMSFKSLAQAIESFEPFGDVCFSDLGKLDVAADALRGVRALDHFVSTKGRLPNAWDWAEAQEIVATCRSLAGDEAVNERMVRLMALTAQGSLCPIAAFLGGVLGQEVIKALSGKFTPLHQWVHNDRSPFRPCRRRHRHRCSSQPNSFLCPDDGR